MHRIASLSVRSQATAVVALMLDLVGCSSRAFEQPISGDADVSDTDAGADDPLNASSGGDSTHSSFNEPSSDAQGLPAVDSAATSPTERGSSEDLGAASTPETGPTDFGPLPEGSTALYVDFYKQECDRGKPYCFRSSLDGETFTTESKLDFAQYEWGHRYLLAVHEESSDGGEDTWVVDDVLQDSAVDAGTRFKMRIDGSLFAIHAPEPFTRSDRHNYSGADRRFTDGPVVTYGSDTLRARFAAVHTNYEIAELTFEFDEALNPVVVEVEALPELTTAYEVFVHAARDKWAENQPQQYVVATCMQNNPAIAGYCEVAAVEDGVAVAKERQELSIWDADSGFHDGEWEPVEPSDPLEEMFTTNVDRVTVDETYGYISSNQIAYFTETGIVAVTCFVPDSLELELCRGVR